MLKVLVGVDASPESRVALRYVCHLLEHCNAQIEAIYVKPDVTFYLQHDFEIPFMKRKSLEEKVEEETEEVERQILNACEVCFAGNVPCKPKIVTGDAAEEILSEARRGDYDLIVLGSHGHSALRGLLLGNVHNKILHYAKRPVLIVREMRTINRVMVAYRGTTCDQRALDFLAPILERKKPEITVFHVREESLGETEAFAKSCVIESRANLEKYGHVPVTKIIEGDFVDETIKEIKNEDYDLVVLGAYGHHRPKYLQLISDEALTIVKRTMRPVLVFRDKATEHMA